MDTITAIANLRDAGYSWHEVGQQLGISAEAARSIYRRSAGAGVAAADDGQSAALPSDAPAGEAGLRQRGADVSSPSPDRPSRPSSAGPSLKSEIDLARTAIAKATRAEIRLKHSILADEEINRVLAERLLEFDKALQRGVIPAIALRMVDETD